MTVEEILVEARNTWGDKPMTLEHIVATIGVVYGDICRQARSRIEQGTMDEAELQKELGNLITSVIRWCDDLGFDPKECIKQSQAAQIAYQTRSK
jgi:fibrillarin-like rRNA methylase